MTPKSDGKDSDGKDSDGKDNTEKQSGFKALSLSKAMLAALEAAAYEEPTPVQAGLIPRAIAGVDVMGQARTGTGKTAAFSIPILEMLAKNREASKGSRDKNNGETGEEQSPDGPSKKTPRRRPSGPQALVLVPTRELAVQVRDETIKLSHGTRARAVALYGGKPIRQQIEKLERGADVAIGTPGRVLDLIARGALVLSDIKCIVLDEADRMLDIGFRPDIEKILKRLPRERQSLLLTATLPPSVERLARRYMKDPEVLDFSAKDVAVETIDQYYFTVDGDRKFDLLVKLLEREDPQQAIIFCRTKRGTDRVQKRLARKVKGVDCIHGDLAQSARDRVMAAFRANKVRILVATDVVGRGIDVTSISHIVNYDTPQFCDDYVHRVGRTGRMGREGVAYTFVTPEEGNELTRIEIRINRLLKRDEITGFHSSGKPQATTPDGEPVEEEKPAVKPPPFGRGGRGPKRYRRAL